MVKLPDLMEKTLMLRKTEGRRRLGQQRMRWLGGITDLMDMSLRKLREIVKDRETHGIAKSRTQLSNWTIAMGKRVTGGLPRTSHSIFAILDHSVGRWQWAGCSVRALLHRHFWCPKLQSHRTGTRCHPAGISTSCGQLSCWDFFFFFWRLLNDPVSNYLVRSLTENTHLLRGSFLVLPFFKRKNRTKLFFFPMKICAWDMGR